MQILNHLRVFGEADAGTAAMAHLGGTCGSFGIGTDVMTLQTFAGAAYRALRGPKDGPSLYDLCDPLLLRPHPGDPHLAKFYKTALGNPALRPLLRRAGLPELRDASRFEALRNALMQARDEEAPDWSAIGQPVAELLDTVRLQHPRPKPMPAPAHAPGLPDIESIIRICGGHLPRAVRCGGLSLRAGREPASDGEGGELSKIGLVAQ